MAYRVEISPEADAQIEAAYEWIAAESPSSALAWFAGLQQVIQSLRSYPRRCPVAPESEAFDVEIRQQLHLPYRILFTIHGRAVRILHVRHAARRAIGELESD